MSDGKVITARAIVDVETTVRAFKVHSGARGLLIRFLVFVAGVVALVFAIGALMREQAGFAIFLALMGIFGIVSAVLRGFKLRNTIAKQLQQADAERQEIQYQIADSHLRIETKDSMSNIEWSKFRKWKEGRGLILLYRHDANFIFVPIEQFEPPAQDALRAQLTAHVPQA